MGTKESPENVSLIRWGSDELALREGAKKRDKWTSSMPVELVM